MIILLAMENEDFLDDFGKDIVGRFRSDPDYMKSLLEDEFIEYWRTNDLRPLLIALKYALRAVGLNKVAEKCHLHKDTLYKIVNGVNEPKLDTFRNVLSSFGVDFSLYATDC
jgi:DNA-binding phage protein